MKNKKVMEAIIVLIVLTVIIALLVVMIVNSVKCKQTTYEYAIDGKIYQTNKCYEKLNGDIRCLKGNELVKVDNYYEVK